MQNNNSEAYMSQRSRNGESSQGKDMNQPAQTAMNTALRQRTESELKALSRFICGHEYVASRLVLDDETLSRAAAAGSNFQIGFLRGELLRTAIHVFQSDIDDLLRPYEDLVQTNTEVESFWDRPIVLPGLESDGDHLNLLHRLVLVMIFREGYAIRACALMLGCRDSVVHILRDEGLNRVDCA